MARILRGDPPQRIRGADGGRLTDPNCCCGDGPSCCATEGGPPTASFSVSRISRIPCVYEFTDTSTLGTCSESWRSDELGGRRQWAAPGGASFECVGPVDDPCSVVRVTFAAEEDADPESIILTVWDGAGCHDAEIQWIDPCQPCASGDLAIGSIGLTQISDDATGFNCWQLSASISVHECAVGSVTVTYSISAWVPTTLDGLGRPDYSGPYDWGAFPGSLNPSTGVLCMDCTFPPTLVRVTAHATDACGCEDQHTQQFTLNSEGDPCGCCHTGGTPPGSLTFTMQGWADDACTAGECSALNAAFSLAFSPIFGEECRYRFFDDSLFSCDALGTTIGLEIVVTMFTNRLFTGTDKTSYNAKVFIGRSGLVGERAYAVSWAGPQAVTGGCGASTAFKTLSATGGAVAICGGSVQAKVN